MGNSAANPDTGRLYGDLTIRGKTRKVALDVIKGTSAISPWGQFATGFAASTQLNRTDWGLTWNQVLETGGVLVSEEIEITLEAIKQGEAVLA